MGISIRPSATSRPSRRIRQIDYWLLTNLCLILQFFQQNNRLSRASQGRFHARTHQNSRLVRKTACPAHGMISMPFTPHVKSHMSMRCGIIFGKNNPGDCNLADILQSLTPYGWILQFTWRADLPLRPLGGTLQLQVRAK